MPGPPPLPPQSWGIHQNPPGLGGQGGRDDRQRSPTTSWYAPVGRNCCSGRVRCVDLATEDRPDLSHTLLEVRPMLIAIFDGRVDASLAERLPEHQVRLFDNRAPSVAAFLEQARGAEVIGVRRIPGWEFDRALVEALPELRFLHKTGTGLDWLDLPALTEHGVLVATNDGFNAASVADHTVLLTQLCLRGTFEKLTQ